MMVSYRLNMSRPANLSVFVGIGRRGGLPDFHWGLRSVGQLRSVLKNASPFFSLHSWQHFDNDDLPWQLAMKQTPPISAAQGFDLVVAQIISTPSKKDRRAESLTDEKWNSRKNENCRGLIYVVAPSTTHLRHQLTNPLCNLRIFLISTCCQHSVHFL